MTDKPMSSVKGVGRASATPDRAIISFRVTALNRVYSESTNELNTRVVELRKRIASAGIQATDHTTGAFRIG